MITVNQLAMINITPRDRTGGDCFIKAMAFILRKVAHYTDIEELVVREQPEYSPYRKSKTGVFSYRFLKHERKLYGKIFKYFRVPLFDKITVKDFHRDNPKGTYLVCIHSHSFAIEDGQVFDANPTRWGAFIREAWVVKNA